MNLNDTNLCDFVDIGLDQYQCSRCNMIIESFDGPPAYICSYINTHLLSDVEKSVFCDADQIENRYKICTSCEYFIDNSCLQCGCRIVRNSEFKNKLFFKDQSCPVNKWGKEI